VSDYKTGAVPPKAEEMVLRGGAELQRVLYAIAARQLVPDNPRVIARLVFLGDDQPKPYTLLDIDQAIADIGAHVYAAGDLLRRGLILPGRDAREEWNDFRLALPAAHLFHLRTCSDEILRRALGLDRLVHIAVRARQFLRPAAARDPSSTASVASR
jgi:hypothetical protein